MSQTSSPAAIRPSVKGAVRPSVIQQSKKVEQYLLEEKKKFEQLQKEPKLLILGTSDSGKSTLLKQLKIIHGKGFTDDEMEEAKYRIWANKYEGVYTFLHDYAHRDPIHGHLQQMKDCWAEKEIKEKWIELEDRPIPCSTKLFLDDLDRVAELSYKPTNQDVLNVRTVTQSVCDTVFEVEGLKIHFYDVSGLKHHRKQWVPYFDSVTTILFVVALSSYNQTMVEDPTVNRMADAIVLFEQIANHPLLTKPDLMIFFNKRDIYEKKVSRSFVHEHFPEYSGKKGSISQGYHFFKEKFLNQNKSKKTIYTHLTCCTDTQTMTKIVQAVIAGVLKRDFRSAGIVE